MAILLSLTALLVAFTGGAGLVLLLGGRSAGLGLAGMAGAAMALGAGIVSLLSFCLGFLVQGFWLRLIVFLICASLAALPHEEWRQLHFKFPRRPFVTLQVVLPLFVAASLGFTLWHSLYRSSLEWDGLFNWESKARIAFLHNGAMPLGYYTGGHDFFHARYPLLLPLLETWMYGFVGHIDQSMIKLIGPYFYLASILLLIGAVSRETSSRWPILFAVVLFALTPQFAFDGGGASSGYADLPLAALYLCAVVYAAEYWRTCSSHSALIVGAVAALLPFTKSEGAVLLLCIAMALGPIIIERRDWKAAASMLAPGFGVWFGWTAFLSLTGATKASDFQPFTPAVLFSHLDRTGQIFSSTIDELLSWKRWSVLWPLTAAVLIFLAVRMRSRRCFFWTAAVLVPLILYPCTYFFSGWIPFEPHIQSSLPRLFIHAAPAAIFIVGVGFGKVFDSMPSAAPAAGIDGVLLPGRVDAILEEASVVLRPLGLTKKDLQRLYRERAAASKQMKPEAPHKTGASQK